MREQTNTRRRTSAWIDSRPRAQYAKTKPHGKRLQTSATEIAETLGGRQTGPHQWMVCCPAHDDKHPSLSLTVGDRGPLVHCFAGCSQSEVISALRERGLWYKPRGQTNLPRRRHDEAHQLWRLAVQHLTHGAPLRNPPYTRSLPRSGEVWICTGPNAWGAAKTLHESGRHSLVWPCAERGYIPCIAYRWPVAGRGVVVHDTADDLVPNEAWADAVRDFSRLLVSRWNAARVDVYGDFEPVRYEPEGVSHAA